MKKKYFYISIFILCILISCDWLLPLRVGEISREHYNSQGVISKYFWGKWIRMDGVNEEWYFSDSTIQIGSDIHNANQSYSENTAEITGYKITRKTNNMITVTPPDSLEFYLFRKTGASGHFSGGVLASDSITNKKITERGISGIGGINIVIQNLLNPSNTIEIESGNDGSLIAEDIIINDEYSITIPEQYGVNNPIDFIVKPTFSGENIGFITINNADQNFKVSYELGGGDSFGYHYMNKTYNLKLIIKNIGSADMLSADYDITVPSGISITGIDLHNILGSIKADGGTKELNFSVITDSFTEDYRDFDVPIKISSVDGKYIWSDQLRLRFFRDTMTIYVESESEEVQGVIISPDSEAFPFKTKWHSGSITIPARASGYILALSGADYNSETKYALRINKKPSGNGSILSSASINEPNNDEESGNIAYEGSDHLGYLGVYDLDFFDIKNSEPPIMPPKIIGTTLTTSNLPTWNWSSPAGAIKYRYSKVDGINWTETSNNSYTPSSLLKEGPHTLYIQSGDSQGNWSVSTEYKILIESKTPYIGGFYKGGYVFYLDDSSGGLVAADLDQGKSVEAGPFSARKICDDLDLNGYIDWYLPNNDELSRMYTNLHLQQIGNFSSDIYWSNDDKGSGFSYYSYYFDFKNGYLVEFWPNTFRNETKSCCVRAIRKF